MHNYPAAETPNRDAVKVDLAACRVLRDAYGAAFLQDDVIYRLTPAARGPQEVVVDLERLPGRVWQTLVDAGPIPVADDGETVAFTGGRIVPRWVTTTGEQPEPWSDYTDRPGQDSGIDPMDAALQLVALAVDADPELARRRTFNTTGDETNFAQDLTDWVGPDETQADATAAWIMGGVSPTTCAVIDVARAVLFAFDLADHPLADVITLPRPVRRAVFAILAEIER